MQSGGLNTGSVRNHVSAADDSERGSSAPMHTCSTTERSAILTSVSNPLPTSAGGAAGAGAGSDGTLPPLRGAAKEAETSGKMKQLAPEAPPAGMRLLSQVRRPTNFGHL